MNTMEVCDASHQIIADLLYERTGQQLTESRRWRVGSALAPVFREHGITNVDQLVCLLDRPTRRASDRDLATEVVEAMLNNETYFFRDRPTFDQLPGVVLPDLAQLRSRERRLSIWSAGCSTGQEAYSLAMLFADQPGKWDGWLIDILGTDVSGTAIKTARNGFYNQFEIQRGLGVAQMLTHFEETPRGWQIHDDVRAPVRFEQRDVLAAPPGPRQYDLILCRNVLLYFDAPTKRRAFDRLASALAPSGCLMLGAGETAIGLTPALSPVPGRQSLYQSAHAPTRSQLTALAS